MRLIAKIFVFVSALFIILYGILPGFFRVEGNFIASYVAGKSLLRGIDPMVFYRFPDFQRLIDASGLSNRIFSLAASTPATFIFDALIAIPPVALSKFLVTAIDLVALVLLVHATAKLATSSVRTAYLVFLSSSYVLATNYSSAEPFIILTLFFATSFIAFSMKAEKAAGVILGLVFPFKVFFAIPAILFLLARKWRVFTYFVLSSLFVIVVTYLVVGESTIAYYMQRVFPFYINGRLQDPFSISYQTGWSFFKRLFFFSPTLNPDPVLSSRTAYVFSISLFKAFTIVPPTYFFYRGIEKNNSREAFVASTFPVIFLSPTGTTFQLLLLAPAIICLAQAALDEQRISTAKLFIVLYAMACIPFFSGLADYLKVQTPILLYERFLLLLSIYVVYLIFQLRTLSRHLLAWRMSMTAALIAAVTVTLYFGDNTPRTTSQFPAVPVLSGDQLETAAFSPALSRGGLIYVGIDSASRNYTVQNEAPLSDQSGNCYHVSASNDGTSLMIETSLSRTGSSGEEEPSVYFRSSEGTASYPGQSGSVSRDGTFGAFVESGDLYIVEMHSKHIPVVDSIITHPFTITQCNFSGDDNPEVAMIIDSLNGSRSIGTYNLQTHRLMTHQNPFPATLICADKGNLYLTYEENDSTSVWVHQATDNGGMSAGAALELFAVHGSIIDINVANHHLYFSSDFERGLDLPTIYRYPLHF